MIERMTNIYETDFLIWTERQVSAMRRRALDEIDWSNVIEEIEDMGSERLHSVESLLVQALRHRLKAAGWPNHRDAPTWRADALDFQRQAMRRFTPSMRQRLNIDDMWRDALRATPTTIDGAPPQPFPANAPPLEELLRA